MKIQRIAAVRSLKTDQEPSKTVTRPSGHVLVATRLAGRRKRLSIRRGLTLFEVLLALVIFVGAFSAIGQLLNSGIRGALQSRHRLLAAQMCQSKLGELVCGAIPLKSSQEVYADDPAWSSTVVVLPAPVSGLMLVQVTVQRTSKNQQAEVKFTLTRYVRDPQLYIAAGEEEELRNQENNSDGTNQ